MGNLEQKADVKRYVFSAEYDFGDGVVFIDEARSDKNSYATVREFIEAGIDTEGFLNIWKFDRQNGTASTVPHDDIHSAISAICGEVPWDDLVDYYQDLLLAIGVYPEEWDEGIDTFDGDADERSMYYANQI